ncbi:helix-turn-helix domain-containing protein [Agaribacter flavus]|uniref:Helix-turn-helix domain-containing protein n=1 Tax=Agaribacter flavus TaxID=1902781 RepID=A0ABV7FNT7_9ALTE
MSQINNLITTLKTLLKSEGITYKKLASALDMSEANVKRMFASKSFSLTRLEEICDHLNIALSDLFLMAQESLEKISQLTHAQEQELLDNPRVLLVAVCVRDGWRFEDIINYYEIDEFECIRLLAKLDKLRIIDFLPNNRFRSLIAQDFRWIPGGRLERFMEQEVMVKFMAPKQGEPWIFRFYLRGRYSQSSIEIIQRKLNQLTKEAAQLNIEDQALPLHQRTHTGMLLAMRPWEPSLFENMRRDRVDGQS